MIKVPIIFASMTWIGFIVLEVARFSTFVLMEGGGGVEPTATEIDAIGYNGWLLIMSKLKPILPTVSLLIMPLPSLYLSTIYCLR